MQVVIIDYGAGNIKSLQFALQRLGCEAIVSSASETIGTADKVIFPGVGNAGSAMKMVKAKGLDQLIPALTQPVLGICLGMQLLCKATEEGDTDGLDVFSSEVKRFSNAVKVPQMGWNTVTKLRTNLFKGISEGEFMYLVHSYYVPKCEEAIAITHYETDYASALNKDNFYGVQFHPEKSSVAGSRILENFLSI
ncbi:imidazole glycerol phosphate synthase subunit HisH [Candidatus Ulvibacter alkanivorans]|uniref:imidazole glycerol phosphate synthase subunit HisH n=1 Tax=Candidatus Ulvibacter alkanivorans TaxID=2267620 RepID=UPI000DF18CC6|nr:imidazole glycerol phosphate synthase subunit HisH [Candidatus Ulvibacter alkanivorans]